MIHSRDSTADTISIMRELLPPDYPIHRHCFTGDWGEAQEWLQAFPNLCLGLTPLVTFRSVSDQPITEAARKIPLDRLLLETGSPHFLPSKVRFNAETQRFLRRSLLLCKDCMNHGILRVEMRQYAIVDIIRQATEVISLNWRYIYLRIVQLHAYSELIFPLWSGSRAFSQFWFSVIKPVAK